MSTRDYATLTASAPGSLMLFGEHAVLHGQPALAAAVDKRITVHLAARQDDTVIIASELGRFETQRGELADDARFRFVLAALRSLAPVLPSGCLLDIRSDFSAELGLGSSAAVTVAVLGVLQAWTGGHRDSTLLQRQALDVIRAVQGRGSGADAAASVFGGVVQVYCDPCRVRPVPGLPPLTVVYSGSKRKTAEVIALVDRLHTRQPTVTDAVLRAMGAVAEAAAPCIARADWQELGHLADMGQGLMAALGLNTEHIARILAQFQADPGIYGAKISGSGLGDCVIGIGTASASGEIPGRIATAITPRGLEIDNEPFASAPHPPHRSHGRNATTAWSKHDIAARLTGTPETPCTESATAFAPANIALCKYWGKRDRELNLPVTSSLSLSLGARGSEVVLRLQSAPDTILLNGSAMPPDSPFSRRLSAYLDLFRPSPDCGYHVTARNTIPTAAGFASSASGFAAMAKALNTLWGWELPPRELSILARLGSGSASRSLFDGLVEWHAGSAADGMDSFAEALDAQWPELQIGLLVVSDQTKPVSSRDAMQHTIESSPLYRAWPDTVTADLAALKAAIRSRDFARLGAIAEGNALGMHATMLAARPAICYWQPATLRMIDSIRQARDAGLPIFLTMDAGPNLKLIYLQEDAAPVRAAFPALL